MSNPFQEVPVQLKHFITFTRPALVMVDGSPHTLVIPYLKSCMHALVITAWRIPCTEDQMMIAYGYNGCWVGVSDRLTLRPGRPDDSVWIPRMNTHASIDRLVAKQGVHW
jgi:hypothetical protein